MFCFRRPNSTDIVFVSCMKRRAQRRLASFSRWNVASETLVKPKLMQARSLACCLQHYHACVLTPRSASMCGVRQME